MSAGLELIDLTECRTAQPMCEAVYSGLSGKEKSLPCRFFYDHTGSQLFEEITRLPEYYLTRCESEILREFSDSILEEANEASTIVEFGSGSSVKTRYLLRAALNKRNRMVYVPIDISQDFLIQSTGQLLLDFERLSVKAMAAEYLTAMDNLPETEGGRLFVFLGSNIGNFTDLEATHFLAKLCEVMNPEDKLLLGADLIKDEEVLHRAYNDSSGVTARFNLNLLRRINEELGSNFQIDQYSHRAPFDAAHSRIEMRLISEIKQTVFIKDLESSFDFSAGEWIRTEWSHKYTNDSIKALAKGAGLQVEREWKDSRGYFAEFLMGKIIRG